MGHWLQWSPHGYWLRRRPHGYWLPVGLLLPLVTAEVFTWVFISRLALGTSVGCRRPAG